MQVVPWILDVGYTVMCVSLMLAMMGHILFGDFEVTMITLLDSITGKQAIVQLLRFATDLLKRQPTSLHTTSYARQHRPIGMHISAEFAFELPHHRHLKRVIT